MILDENFLIFHVNTLYRGQDSPFNICEIMTYTITKHFLLIGNVFLYLIVLKITSNIAQNKVLKYNI